MSERQYFPQNSVPRLGLATDTTARGGPGLVAKIGKTSGHFDTSIDALKGMKATSVPDSVILAMVEA
jgi:hypothetical protein